MERPVYELKIDPTNDAIVNAVAIVSEPAIESDFIAFSKNQEMMFSLNDEKMELLGAAMIPDMKIFRRDEDGKEYDVFFSANTIREIAQLYFKRGFQTNLNIEHTGTPAKSYIFQSYIVDSARGLNSPVGLDLPNGAWVVGVKVDDTDVWTDIKAGKQKGFSIEGVFQFFNKVEIKETNELDREMSQFLYLMDKIKNK